MQVQPYLFFDGRCEEAITFYRAALNAEVVMMMRFDDHPDAEERSRMPPMSGNKVMHAHIRVGEATILASDGRCQGKPDFEGFALTLLVANEAEANRVFAALADGGEVRMKLAKTFFSSRFGMVADRFGVSWMVYVGS